MDLDLQDRVYLVTGGSRGIGHAVASALSQEGAHVVVCARDEAAAQEAARVAGATVTSACADVTDAGSVRALVETIGERHGRLDGIVHNAGRFGGGPLEGLPREGLDDGLATKVSGPLGLTQAALGLLRAGDRSAIVSVSGVTAQRIVPGAAVTAIANAGVIALTSYFAHELLPDGIRANCVIPGYTLTGVWEQRAAAIADAEGLSQDEARDAILQRMGMGHARWGRPEEIAAPIVWLLSAASSFVNGISMRVDGGQLPTVDA
jgi:NAD(P)-dependent dehydrogenase (short-subunit alcohol dehydrogenase family)